MTEPELVPEGFAQEAPPDPPVDFECPECHATGMMEIHRLDCPTVHPQSTEEPSDAVSE